MAEAQHDRTCAQECNNTDREHLYPDWPYLSVTHSWGVTVRDMHDSLDAMRQAMEALEQCRVQLHRKWCALTGAPLTLEQATALENTVNKLATVTAVDRMNAETYVARVFAEAHRAQATQQMWEALTTYAHDIVAALGDMFQRLTPVVYNLYGILDLNTSSGQPNYDHWWIGLEDTIGRRHRAQAHTRMHRANTRGRYSYGNASKAQSYWRHTRAR